MASEFTQEERGDAAKQVGVRYQAKMIDFGDAGLVGMGLVATGIQCELTRARDLLKEAVSFLLKPHPMGTHDRRDYLSAKNELREKLRDALATEEERNG